MSFVGKILTVVQLLLSILFMAFAGAIFTQQNNWKEIAKKAQKEVTDSKAEMARLKDEKDKNYAKRDDEAKQLESRANTAEGGLAGLRKEVAGIRDEKDKLEQKIQTQSALASAAADEATHRHEEVLKQRVANEELHKAFDGTSKSVREKADENFVLDRKYDLLKKDYTALLKEKGALEQVVRAHGLTADTSNLARVQAPPPKREGLITEVKNDKTNRPKFLTIQIGKDDDLAVGHIVDVIRTGDGGEEPQYLCKARIVDIYPRKSVCEVIQPPKNGIIKVGDSVTTNL